MKPIVIDDNLKIKLRNLAVQNKLAFVSSSKVSAQKTYIEITELINIRNVVSIDIAELRVHKEDFDIFYSLEYLQVTGFNIVPLEIISEDFYMHIKTSQNREFYHIVKNYEDCTLCGQKIEGWETMHINSFNKECKKCRAILEVDMFFIKQYEVKR